MAERPVADRSFGPSADVVAGQPPRATQAGYAGLDGLLIVAEVAATGIGVTGQASRIAGDARAGVLRYWLAEQDGAERW